MWQDGVVTLGASLVQKFVGARGWGALTEHHLLVAIRDAIIADPDITLHQSITAAVACCVDSATCNPESNQTANNAGQQQQRGLLALAVDAEGASSTTTPELRVYSSAAIQGSSAAEEAATARQSCLHLLLAPPVAALKEMSARSCWGDMGILQCSLPNGLDSRNTVRTIVSLQGHNNCGRLYGAALELVQQATGRSASPAVNQSKKETAKIHGTKKKSKKEKKEKRQKKERKEKKQKKKQKKHKELKKQNN